MKEPSIRELKYPELKDGAELLGRGMRDNPNNIRAFGPNPEHRKRALARMFRPILQRAHIKGNVFGAFRNGEMIGLYSMTQPGECQLKVREKLGMVPTIFLGNSLAVPLRVLKWIVEWSRHDPTELHWHFGPFAVDPQAQGRGIGSVMLGTFCTRMDRQNALAFLETDKPENVRFYERFGFVTTSEALVLGTPNWFMLRQPRSG
jgi:RimJ/RimL family protein N-acetyltransferase